MAFRWRADDDPPLNACLVVFENFRGSGPLLLRNSMFLSFFRRDGGPDPLSPSGSAHGTGLCLHLLRYTVYWKPILSCASAFVRHCVLSIDRQVERERERCVFFLNFVIILTQRARLRISKIRVYLCKKKKLSTRCPWVTVLHYKQHLRRWRASKKRFGFLKEERKCSERLTKWTFTTCK